MIGGAKVVSIGTPAALHEGAYAGDQPRRGRAGGNGAAERRRGRDEPELPMLPSDCPIICLGKRKQVYYFLDELGELIDLAADKVAQKGILSLFGTRADLVREYWPRYGKPDKTGHAEINGWKVDVASELLMSACAAEGVFDPVGRVRGRGAHLHDDGALVMHCGDLVLIGGAAARPNPEDPGEMIEAREPRWHQPGLHGKYVYPTGPAGQRPAIDPASTDWAHELLTLLGSWHWKRPIDEVLTVGFIVASMGGGALRWRPHAWVTGDTATGKTTLQELFEGLFDGSLLQSADASEAGIRQVLGQDTLPVGLDEAEAEDNNTARMNALVKLARIASSGAMGLRGGADHKGHMFAIKSCFLFSSVLMPALLPQDRNRLAILELMPLAREAKPPVLDPVWLRACGRALRRRLVDQWHRFPETLADYRKMLADVGHGGRSADQFGTLLACADLALYDHGSEAGADDGEAKMMWAQALAADTMVERADEMSNADRCIAWISSSTLQAVGGEAPADVSSWVQRVFDDGQHDKARARLGAAGMRVVQVREKGERPVSAEHAELSISDPLAMLKLPIAAAAAGELYLAVASAHRGLDPLFRDTPWQGRAAAAGGWGQALRRVPGAISGEKVRIGGKTMAVVLVPLALFSELGEGS